MIRRLLVIVLRMRARHHDRLTQSLGAAVLDAQQRREWDSLGSIWARRERHRLKRDVLTLQASAMETHALPVCCDGNCGQGRRCTARSH